MVLDDHTILKFLLSNYISILIIITKEEGTIMSKGH